jgi:Nicotinic acid mononucleotide adenylyltransferase
MADDARQQFGYDLVLLVPSYRPPHKDLKDDPGPEQRLRMLRLAVAGDEGFLVDDCEILRGGTSYTIDTLAQLRSRYDIEGKPGLLIGDDLVPGFSSWRSPGALAEEADIICAHRSREEELELGYPHRYADNPIIRISSSDLRARIAGGRPFRRMLPEAVYRCIVDEGLYGLR